MCYKIQCSSNYSNSIFAIELLTTVASELTNHILVTSHTVDKDAYTSPL